MPQRVVLDMMAFTGLKNVGGRLGSRFVVLNISFVVFSRTTLRVFYVGSLVAKKLIDVYRLIFCYLSGLQGLPIPVCEM